MGRSILQGAIGGAAAGSAGRVGGVAGSAGRIGGGVAGSAGRLGGVAGRGLALTATSGGLVLGIFSAGFWSCRDGNQTRLLPTIM